MIEIEPNILHSLRAEAALAAPEECCGILLGQVGRIAALLPARNVHPTPRTHFEIDPQTLIDAHRAARGGGMPIAGYYHSHPDGSARPSSTDAAMASGDGRVWAIVGGGQAADSDVAFWRDDKEGFTPLSYSLGRA